MQTPSRAERAVAAAQVDAFVLDQEGHLAVLAAESDAPGQSRQSSPVQLPPPSKTIEPLKAMTPASRLGAARGAPPGARTALELRRNELTAEDYNASPFPMTTPAAKLQDGGASSVIGDAMSNLGIAVPSPAGCSACRGHQRGEHGETFCRRCGRPYHTAAMQRGDGPGRVVDPDAPTHGPGMEGVYGWCDVAIGAVAIRLHRLLRGD